MTITRQDYPIEGIANPLTIFTVEGDETGPTIALTGAIHGDEYEGPVTLTALLASIDTRRLKGRLLVVPVSNPDATAACMRCSPSDGKNLARVFPGKAEGSPTEIMAHLIATHAIRQADALIDLHSGGVSTDCVLFAGYGDQAGGAGRAARDMAVAFGAPYVWRHAPPMAPGRTLSVAWEENIPAIYVEAGGGPSPSNEVLQAYLDGVFRVLGHLGVYGAAPSPKPQRFLTGAGDLDYALMAPTRGLCKSHVELMEEVTPDTPCFTLYDLDGTALETVKAGASGAVVFARRNLWAEKGDLLLALAVADPLED